MEFSKALSIALTLVCAVCADYSLLPGDKRTVSGKVNEPFSTKTTLPGVYDSLVSGKDKITFTTENCSTPQFTCSIVKNSATMSTVTISGYMSYGLKWITFFSSQGLIPISIIFLTDNVWNDLATGSIQPQYSLPLVIRAKGLHTVTLTCSILTNPIGIGQITRQISTGTSNVVFYRQGKKPLNDVSKYPQIMNLEDRTIVLHSVMTLTVKQSQAIDFYACNTNASNADYWLTHTIDWTTTPSAAKRVIFRFFLGWAAVFSSQLCGVCVGIETSTPLLMLFVVN